MKRFVLVALSVFILAGGCAGRQELSDEILKARKAGEAGVTKVYPVDTNQAWEITMAVFRWEKTDEIEEHRGENYVITSTGMNMLVYGSVMGVWIEPADSRASKITVITKRRVENDIFTRLDAETFYRRFEQGVKIVNDGKNLPLVPPIK